MRALALALLLTVPAQAYVRSRTSHTPGTAIFWPGACVFIQPDSDGSPDFMPDEVFATVQRSIAAWQSLSASCGFFQLNYDEPAKLEAHLDGKNIIKFRTDMWCHPEDKQNHNVCYDRNAAAITTVFFLDRQGDSTDGYIIDADVELNNINYTFVTVVEGQPLPSARPGTAIADFENTLTHELGHLQGLDHTCADTSSPTNEVDENGNPPPPCNRLALLTPAELMKVRDATMFNSAQPGEIKKRTPEVDDVAGICNIYPADQASKHTVCKHTDLNDYATNGCQLAPGRAGLAAFLFMLGVLFVLRRSLRRS